MNTSVDLAACRSCQEQLPWLANGTLDAALRADVERHLEGCAACRQEAAFLHALASDMPRPAAAHSQPAPFSQLLARINRRDERRTMLRVAAAVAGLALAASLALVVLREPSPEYRAVTEPLDAATSRVQLLVVLERQDRGALADILARYDADIVSSRAGEDSVLLEFRLPENRSVAALERQLMAEPMVRRVSRSGN